MSADCVRALNDLHQQPISAHPRTPQTEKWAKVIRFAGSEIRGHRHSERNSNGNGRCLSTVTPDFAALNRGYDCRGGPVRRRAGGVIRP